MDVLENPPDAVNEKQLFSNHRFPESASPTMGGQGHFFFGIVIAEAATHCHLPSRSTQVSVKR